VAEKPKQPCKSVWLVDSLDRLTSFPPAVRHKLGFALYQAQIVQKHESAKMLHGFGDTVWQVRVDDPGGTPGCKARRLSMSNRESTPSSGNVFADLNLPQPDDLLAKAELAAKIIAEIQRRRLTQNQAAAILGIDQPKVSALKQGKLSGFSIERLMRFLLLLGRDVEITVKGRPKARAGARLRVA
jgi:predicted XRE-type DNA-binding protein